MLPLPHRQQLHEENPPSQSKAKQTHQAKHKNKDFVSMDTEN